jgi:hypothetical protein
MVLVGLQSALHALKIINVEAGKVFASSEVKIPYVPLWLPLLICLFTSLGFSIFCSNSINYDAQLAQYHWRN